MQSYMGTKKDGVITLRRERELSNKRFGLLTAIKIDHIQHTKRLLILNIEPILVRVMQD